MESQLSKLQSRGPKVDPQGIPQVIDRAKIRYYVIYHCALCSAQKIDNLLPAAKVIQKYHAFLISISKYHD